MSKPPGGAESQGSSTRPYLIRALHDWCTDNGFTPYVAVFVDRGVQVPMEYVKNHEIVLNIGFEATSGLRLGNETIEFKARFGGVARDIVVPIDHVVAIYARENGQGMAFPAPHADGGEQPATPIEPRADVGRGLRLASSDDAPTATGARPMPAEPVAPSDPTPPEPPVPPAGSRPSLKRVK
ncbi:MAG: ClpXP protease specificity-enhancing factor [Burkholderiaceae bacterium]|nr:MAG: ClpXP protease specificity-enhancing factor [Burkholderiaceae bacterium]MCC7285012.1 ClpXP protease specificity-enhancing factor [Burkholderiaceae bacterium]